jgi:SSS family solute:Na+ symporter
MYAAAAANAGSLTIVEPTTAYLVIADAVLPIFIKGIFLTGLIATIMSTMDSFTFLGAMNISHDLYKNIFHQKATDKKVMTMTKIGIVITAAFASFLALLFESIVSMWYTIGTIGISALLVPILAGFFYKGRKSPRAGLFCMIFGAFTSIIWFIHGNLNLDAWGWPQYLFSLEPLYPGLFISFIIFFVVNIIDKSGGK